MSLKPEVLSRDILVMGALTVSLFFIGYGVRGVSTVLKVRVNECMRTLAIKKYFAWTLQEAADSTEHNEKKSIILRCADRESLYWHHNQHALEYGK